MGGRQAETLFPHVTVVSDMPRPEVE